MQIEDKQSAVPAVPVHPKPGGNRRSTTIYRQAIRTIRKSANLVAGIDGCEEAQSQLRTLEEVVIQKLQEMKDAARIAKNAAKTGGDED